MIKSVVLENWKSHEKTELEFTSGTNVLIGQMGAGKTSVMDGITFALFGTFPALQARKLKLDQCIMDKPEKKQKAKVQLIFSLNGSSYEIIREVERGKGTTFSEFKKDGTVIEKPNSQRVTEAIIREIQVDYELFSRAVYSEQNQIDYFLQIPAGQRKRKIDELLKLDRLEKARSALTTVVTRLKTQAKDKAKAIEDFERENIAEKIRSLEAEMKEIEENKSKNSSELEGKRELLEKISTELKSLEEKEKRVRDLENQLSSIKGQLGELSEKIESLKHRLGDKLEKDLKHEKEELERKSKEITLSLEKLNAEGLQKELSELSARVGSLKTTVEELSTKAKEKEEVERKLSLLKKEDWKKKLDDKKEELKRLEESLTGFKIVIENENKRIGELEKAGDKCPVCDSPISKTKKEELKKKSLNAIESAKSRIKELEERISKISLDEIEGKIHETETLSRRLEELDVAGKLKKAKEELFKAEAELEKKKAEQEKVAADRKELEKEKEEVFKRLSDAERVVELQGEYTAAREQKTKKSEELSGIEKQIAEMKFDENLLSQRRKAKEELGIEVSKLEGLVASLKQLLEEKGKRLDEIKLKEKQIAQWKEDVGFLRKQAGAMEVFKKALEATQVQLREETLSALNVGMEDIWPRIYPYGDYTGLRLGIEGGDYILQLKRRDGNWIDVEGTASGGERSAACLALRIAFSLVLTQNLSWLVLDEPTHNLDSQGVAMLSKALREHLPELVEQVFIITHDDEMESAVSGALYRLERDKEQDEPSRAILVNMGAK
ncbi:MAG: AAA family ATPase [Candidatus Diapherotrites archaeon]|nr:AAA family ATPase [Candidatus Diapherotrites archaeon]